MQGAARSGSPRARPPARPAGTARRAGAGAADGPDRRRRGATTEATPTPDDGRAGRHGAAPADRGRGARRSHGSGGRRPSGREEAPDDRPAELELLLDRLVRDVPDYPQPGVVFKDITPLLADPAGFAAVSTRLVASIDRGTAPTQVVGMEARGFILAAPVAYRLGAGFVPVRKAGKLPRRDARAELRPGVRRGRRSRSTPRTLTRRCDRVLVVDDVLATGGTAAATIELIRRAGGDGRRASRPDRAGVPRRAGPAGGGPARCSAARRC